MSDQLVYVKRSFDIMAADEKLHLKVKVWFIVFVVEKNCMYQKLFRQQDETSDFEKFLKRHNIADIDKVPPCVCTCKRRVTNPVYRVLGRCYECNQEKCKVITAHKNAVWARYHQSDETGDCYCCKARIRRNDFSAAHVVAVCHGGMGVVDNLRPTCHSCNAAMMTTNLYVYKAELNTIEERLRTDPNFKALAVSRWMKLVQTWNPTSKRTFSG